MNLLIDLDDRVIHSYEWRSDQRVPVVDELLDIGTKTYRVTQVIWILQQDQPVGTIPAAGVTLEVREVNR